MPRCDVIIPMYNNAPVLPATVAALAAQSIPAGWEVGVIFTDDGSGDGSGHLAATVPLPAAWQRQVVTGPHAGPGEARNRALARSRADVLLLLGADIALRPGAVAAHLQWHAQQRDERDGAIGFVRWDPRVRPTPLMMWMEHGGPQNNFDALLGKDYADPRHFFNASHLSVKRSLLQREPGPFAPALRGYGWEDLELGRRLAQRGLRLRVVTGARALHTHYYSLDAICRRQELVGRNLVHYQRLHPAVPLLPPPSLARRIKYWLATTVGVGLVARVVVRYGEERWSLPRWYRLLTSFYFWRGVWRSLPPDYSLNRGIK